jgi:hypothetical protein
MHGIHDDQATSKRGLGGNTHALSIALHLGRCFNAHHGMSLRVYFDKAGTLSSALVYILNIPVRRVCSGKKVPAIKERLPCIVLYSFPG